MKPFLVAAAALGALFAATAASAQTSGSIGYTRIDTDVAKVDGVTGRVTWMQGWYGVEGELTIGTNHDLVTVGSSTVRVSLEHQESIFARVQWPLAENANVFARVGYTNTKFDNSGSPVRRGAWNQAASYGVGVEYFFDDRNGIRGDYTLQDYKAFDAADALSIAYVRKF